jgi:hypothetical protein
VDAGETICRKLMHECDVHTLLRPPAGLFKASLDILWLKDESLDDSDNLPPPEVIAQEIVNDLEAALDRFVSFPNR